MSMSIRKSSSSSSSSSSSIGIRHSVSVFFSSIVFYNPISAKCHVLISIRTLVQIGQASPHLLESLAGALGGCEPSMSNAKTYF